MLPAEYKFTRDVTDLHPLIQFIWQRTRDGAIQQYVLAEKAGISHSMLDKYFKGHDPSLSSLDALIRVLGYELVPVRKAANGKTAMATLPPRPAVLRQPARSGRGVSASLSRRLAREAAQRTPKPEAPGKSEGSPEEPHE